MAHANVVDVSRLIEAVATVTDDLDPGTSRYRLATTLSADLSSSTMRRAARSQATASRITARRSATDWGEQGLVDVPVVLARLKATNFYSKTRLSRHCSSAGSPVRG